MASEKFLREAVSAIRERGFCVLRGHFEAAAIEACRNAFWPRLSAFLSGGHEANRGAHRHFLAMPFERPIFALEFFFDAGLLGIVRGLLGDRVVVDQWSCDVPVRGSEYQQPHVDYQRPLFSEVPDLVLPPFAIVVSFGLVRIAPEHGPIEIASGTHRMRRTDAMRAVETGDVKLEAVPLEIGDVLIRHPWAVHRGTPNMTEIPRALATIRYVRQWYADSSREVETIPREMWDSFALEQRELLRFPVEE